MNRIEIAAIVIIICLPIFPNLIPSAFAQEYNGALDITVEEYDKTHEYTLCGGELHELNLDCLNFKGSEFETNVGSFPYQGDKNVKLYGCVIDETASLFACDSMDASPITKLKYMTLFINETSKIPLPSVMTESSIQTLQVEEESNDNDSNDDEGSADEESKTYCDVPNPSNPCHDRRDGDEETGLYTCLDGSHEEDWKDCNGDNDSDNNNNDDDDKPNCNDVEYGTNCDGSEDEDSTLDDDTEYEDDGYLDDEGPADEEAYGDE
jgi:hypothetical protein